MSDNPQTLSSSPTSLDPRESTDVPKFPSPSCGNSALPVSPYYRFRHSSWQPLRAKIYDALACLPPGSTRRHVFSQCGSGAWVARSRNDPDQFKFVPDHCHDRFCIPCARSRSLTIQDNLSTHLNAPPYRFLTLTLRRRHDPLAVTIDRLLRSFRRLRSRLLWRERVRGGVAFLEITRGSTGTTWHVHLHAILDGSYIPQPSLSATWKDITGDSPIVDIRLVREPRAALKYLAKYVTKPFGASVTSNRLHLQELILALADRKLLYAFGTWHRFNLLAKPHDPDWKVIGHVTDFLHAWNGHEELAPSVLAAYHTYATTPNSDLFTIRAPPPPDPLTDLDL